MKKLLLCIAIGLAMASQRTHADPPLPPNPCGGDCPPSIVDTNAHNAVFRIYYATGDVYYTNGLPVDVLICLSPTDDTSIGPAAQTFATTHWSVVMNAGDSSPRAEEYPFYAYVRRQGRTVAASEDFTQEFFARLLEHEYLRLADPNRGRFRNFLFTSFKHFLINDWIKSGREKRGRGLKILSFDAELAPCRKDT